MINYSYFAVLYLFYIPDNYLVVQTGINFVGIIQLVPYLLYYIVRICNIPVEAAYVRNKMMNPTDDFIVLSEISELTNDKDYNYCTTVLETLVPIYSLSVERDRFDKISYNRKSTLEKLVPPLKVAQHLFGAKVKLN